MAVINLVAMDIKGLWGIEERFIYQMLQSMKIKRKEVFPIWRKLQ